jgi:hypothetical protein
MFRDGRIDSGSNFVPLLLRSPFVSNVPFAKVQDSLYILWLSATLEVMLGATAKDVQSGPS